MHSIRAIFSKEFLYRKYYNFLQKCFPAVYKKNSPYNEAKIYYLNNTGKFLKYSDPRDINEKLFWLHRYWQNPLVVECSDKYMVREYIKKHGCEELLLPLYGAYDSAAEIDFDALPSSFVLKCNHGCGYNILCRNKADLDIEKTRKKLDGWMSETYGLENHEYHYSKITPKIICEKYLDSLDSRSVIDYKIHCVNGEPFFFFVCFDRNPEARTVEFASYSLDWERLPYLKKESAQKAPRPALLDEMINYARILSKPFPYARVDFYFVDNKIYFGEITFSPAGNIMHYYKDSTLKMMGEKLVLPQPYKGT